MKISREKSAALEVVTENVNAVIEITARYFGVPLSLIKCDSCRVRTVSRARHVAMYLACKLHIHVSKADIARVFNMQGPSVFYGCANVEGLLDEGKLVTEVSELEQFIRSGTDAKMVVSNQHGGLCV